MTFFQIIILLVIGVLILVGGIVTKKVWLMLVSIIPLVLVMGQLVMLFLMVL